MIVKNQGFIKKQEASGLFSKFLLVGYKFMLEIHLRQTPFTYSACAKFTKNKKIIEKFKERGYSRYIYFNKINKACCQHDMA